MTSNAASRSTIGCLRTRLSALAVVSVWGLGSIGGCGEAPEPASTGESPQVGEAAQPLCLAGPAFPLCAGHCGALSCSAPYPDICCACDPGCTERGDCCCDYGESCTGPDDSASCEGHCDAMAPAGCWCDAACRSYGDCCDDVETFCALPTCDGHCGGVSPAGCFCDTECVGMGDCCSDYWDLCTEIEEIDAGTTHTCARLGSGAIRCWGYGTLGYPMGPSVFNQIGDDEFAGSGGDIDVGGAVVQFAAGELGTCAILDGGSVRCWGEEEHNAGFPNPLVPRDVGDDEAPGDTPPVPLVAPAVQVAVADEGACAVLSTGAIQCWGLTYTIAPGHERPDGTVNVAGHAVQVALARIYDVCALMTGGQVVCWGVMAPHVLPQHATAVDLGWPAVEVVAGSAHFCARSAKGAVRCWGENGSYQLGVGDLASGDITLGDDEPVTSAPAVNLGGSAVALAAAGRQTCALLASGKVRCWGKGDPTLPSALPIIAFERTVVGIAAGAGHACALLDTGKVRCWGKNDYGQLGYGHTMPVTPAGASDLFIF